MATELPVLPDDWFTTWWEPRSFLKQVLDLQQRISSVDQITRPEFQPLLEAHVAARFAVARAQLEPTEVRLRRAADRFPDFEVRVAQRTVPFALVEAYRTGSRRDEEFKRAAERKAAGLQETVEYFDPGEELVRSVPAIERAIAAKAAKRYVPAPALLVYVNYWIFDGPPLDPTGFGNLVKAWRDSFLEIWLVWGAFVIRCWPNAIQLEIDAETAKLLMG